jgi:hypothetical protein
MNKMVLKANMIDIQYVIITLQGNIRGATQWTKLHPFCANLGPA